MRTGQRDFPGHILAEREVATGERKGQESLTVSGKPFHIRIQLSAALCRYAGCPSELALSAATVGSALRQLEPSHPRLYRSICRESGAVRPHVNLFLNSDRIDELNGMDSRLQPGDILTVLPAVSGGTPCRTG
ncbi:MAG: MoaD/ThiS family protein [Acidobacteria bacterium]|nr:MoaD/ThiS family protein [Acidobacteriota bacterium]